MRVLHVTEAADYGVLRHLSLIVPELQRLGCQCSVLLFGSRIRQDAVFPCPQLTLPFKGGRLFCAWRAVDAVAAGLDWSQADAIHLHSFIAGTARRRKWPQPLLYSPHAFNTCPPNCLLTRQLAARLERRWAAHTDAFAFVSSSELQEALRLQLPSAKFHIAENALPDDFSSHLLPRSQARAILEELAPGIFQSDLPAGLVPSRLAPQKNPQLLIDAVRLAGENCPFRLIFCGDGPLYEKLRKKQGPYMFFAGYIPKLSQLLRAFDFAVIPSFYEGLSYSLLECLAAGLPIAISSQAAPRTSEQMLPFPPDNPQAALLSILNAINITNKVYIKQNTIRQQAETLLAIYNSIASSPMS